MKNFSDNKILIIIPALIVVYIYSFEIEYSDIYIYVILLLILFATTFYIAKGFGVLGRTANKTNVATITKRITKPFRNKKFLLAKNGHNGIALLYNEDKSIKQWFYANSQITLHKVSELAFYNDDVPNKNIMVNIRISKEDVKNIESSMNEIMTDEKCILCTEDTLDSPHIPLAIVTPDLEFQYISNSESDYGRIKTTPYKKYANFKENTELRTRVFCSEKKILHKIFSMYSTEELKDCTLLFFSEMAPCTSCLSMLRLEKYVNTFKEIKCYYKDYLLLLDSGPFEGASKEDQAEIQSMIKNLIEANEKQREKLLNKKDIDEK